MSQNNRDWFALVKQIPGWIKGLLALVTAIVGFIGFWRQNQFWATVVLAAILVVAILVLCIYVLTKRTDKGTWQHARFRRWALVGLILIPLLTIAGVVTYRYYQTLPPKETRVLIANFTGPDPERYHVTTEVYEKIQYALRDDPDVVVEKVDLTFDTIADARVEGRNRKAAVVIWGTYGTTKQVVQLFVHFEPLLPPTSLPSELLTLELGPTVLGEKRLAAVSEFEGGTVQTNLGHEMTYLTLFTTGLVRYAKGELDGAIGHFTDALAAAGQQPAPALNQGTVFRMRGLAYDRKGDSDRAIADYDQSIAYYGQAIQRNPNAADIYFFRGNAYFDKGDYDQAIADYGQAIQFNPNDTESARLRDAAQAAKERSAKPSPTSTRPSFIVGTLSVV